MQNFNCLIFADFVDQIFHYVVSIESFGHFHMFQVPLQRFKVIPHLEKYISHKFIDLVVIITTNLYALQCPFLRLLQLPSTFITYRHSIANTSILRVDIMRLHIALQSFLKPLILLIGQS